MGAVPEKLGAADQVHGEGDETHASRGGGRARPVLDPDVHLEAIGYFKQGSEKVHLHFNKISLASPKIID